MADNESSPIDVVAEAYTKMVTAILEHAMKLTNNNTCIAAGVLNSAAERLKSINHFGFVMNMQDEARKDAQSPAATTGKEG